jgi:hypothetical protein
VDSNSLLHHLFIANHVNNNSRDNHSSNLRFRIPAENTRIALGKRVTATDVESGAEYTFETITDACVELWIHKHITAVWLEMKSSRSIDLPFIIKFKN